MTSFDHKRFGRCAAQAFAALALAASCGAQDMGRPLAGPFQVLSEAGDVSTPAKAQATMDALAARLIAQGGGIIVVTNDVAKDFRPENTYQTERKDGPTVTILDIRKGYLTVLSSQIGFDRRAKWSGMHFKRTLNMKGESLPHWGSTAVVAVENNIVSGSSSFMKQILFPVKAGRDARIYPASIDGLWPGASMNLHGPKHEFIRIKSLRWDPEKRLNYCTADLAHDHPKGAQLQNKHNTNAMIVHSHSNADNQTFWLDSRVYQYGVGDSFAVSGTHHYQGNVMSGLGDEGAVCLNAEVIHDLDAFRAEVESFDPRTGELVYRPGTVNARKLSMSRPLVNLNQRKWITRGHVLVVPPGHTYRGRVYKNGQIIASEDSPWDESAVGRYFALDDPAERYNPGEVPGGGYWPYPKGKIVRRWYRITGLKRNEDGTKSLQVLRVFWYSRSASSVNLFRWNNYTMEYGREPGAVERPLKYIIAPGGLVYDISKGWTDTRTRRPGNHYVTQRSDPRTLMIAPNGDRGTRFDFEPGDPVVQAVGPDPYVPRPIRIRMFDEFPSCLPNPAIQITNNGMVGRSAGIVLNCSKARTREQVAKRKDQKPGYVNGIEFNCAVGAGIRFRAHVTEAAMVMEQADGNAQPIKWKHRARGYWSHTSIVGRPEDGHLAVSGGALNLEHSSLTRATLTHTRGISATKVRARNLRGVDVPVPKGAADLRVDFPTREADAKYAVHVQPTWPSACYVTRKESRGFTVAFTQAPQEGRTIDWILVR